MYFTEISIFLKKNNAIGCRLFIKTIKPFGLEFFSFLINLLTI